MLSQDLSTLNNAERYDRGRPYFHELTIKRFAEGLGIQTILPKALDIACGTGLSTKALETIADQVFGTDCSEEMLTFAKSNEAVKFFKSYAEHQPFKDEDFDLLTVCSGIHLFELQKFYREAQRLLKPEACLLIYDNFFLAYMEESIAFTDWYMDIFLQRFPLTTYRTNFECEEEEFKSQGFKLVFTDDYDNEVQMSKEELIHYLTTKTNVREAIEREEQTYTEVEEWLSKELTPFFKDREQGTFLFGNWIKALRKL